MKKQQAGFTLIELIIVIVILGILAVTAAPRFIDIQSEARTETLNGVKGALQSSAQLVFAKAAIAGRQNLDGGNPSASVDVNGVPVQIHNGYPDAFTYDSIDTVAGSPPDYGIDTFLDIDSSQLSLARVGTNEGDSLWYITFSGETPPTNNCFVIYRNAGPGAVPDIQVFSSGC